MDVKYESIQIFNDNISTFKETSKDNSSQKTVYMTESKVEVINFDKVKEQYIHGMKLSKPPCSNDALYIDKSGRIYFVEFKNGKMSRPKIYNLYNKIYDSLLIFTDITERTIKYCRENVNFILVYNESKNPNERQDSAKASIGKYFTQKAKKKYVRFDLERFEQIYFHEVFAYTEKEFEEIFLASIV